MTSDGSTETDGRVLRARDQRESRRADILRVALEVFADKGYHQTRISDIIEAAGIARGTFYLYFESKSAIFLELLDRLLEELRGSVVGVDTGDGAPPIDAQLLETTRRIVDAVRSNKLLTTIIVREAVGLDAEVDAKLRDFYGQLHAYIRESLDEGRALGIVRDLDTHVAATCILGSVKQLMEQYVIADASAEHDVDREAAALLDYHISAVLVR